MRQYSTEGAPFGAGPEERRHATFVSHVVRFRHGRTSVSRPVATDVSHPIYPCCRPVKRNSHFYSFHSDIIV